MTHGSSFEPSRLSVSVGTSMGDSFSVELDEGRVRYSMFGGLEGHADVDVQVSAARWRGFRRSIDQLDAMAWQGVYEESFRTDGVEWSIDIAYLDGAIVQCRGYDCFPPERDGPDFTRAFERFCRGVSRLVGGLEFGWQKASPRESKGSRRRMFEWVHEHRRELELELCRQVPSLDEFVLEPGSSIKWLAPDSDGREIRDGLWPMVLPPPTPQEDGFWPKSGPVWDAAGIAGSATHERLGTVLVEAKSHVAELLSPRMSLSSYEANRTREAALEEAKLAYKASSEAPWTLTYYQLANRLAFLYYLRCRRSQPAWLINVYFCGDRFTSGGTEVVGPADASEWIDAIGQAKSALGLVANHPLADYVADVFLPVVPAR